MLLLVYPTTSWCAQCTPSFPEKEGWLGGDAAYSVPLDVDRSLWLFADTYVGFPAQKTRRGTRLVANSIAISNCRDDSFNIHYYIPAQRAGVSLPFFDSATSAYRYWPMDGFTYDGRLYVVLSGIAAKPGGTPFDFKMVGVKLAAIKNPLDDPSRWSIEYSEVASGPVAFPGVAAVLARRWVYLFAVLADVDHPTHPLMLTRIALEHLDKPAASMEYLAKDGGWKHGLDWSDARIVIEDGHTEMSVRYHPHIRKWVAVQQKPGIGTGAGVRTADHLEGPWSAFEGWFLMAEPPHDADDKIFCYAAKEHIEFARDSDIVITYVCNSFDPAKLADDMSLYRPQVVRLPLQR